MYRYRVVELVGEGSFGRVFRGVRRSDGATVALKLIPKLGHTEKEVSSLRSECKIQMSLRHPNVVEMVDAFETPKEVVAVTEFVPGGDLHTLRRSRRCCDEETVRRVAGDLMSALHYLHSKRVLHRDLKPANVLLTAGGSVKICDFGFARHLGLETMVLTSIKGTPLYMAPELIEERPYDHTADLWSAGAILYEMAVGHPPFPTNSLFQLIKKIRYETVRWPSNLSQTLRHFLKGLLEKDPRKRSGWNQILVHPFVRDVLNLDLDLLQPESLTKTLTESQELAKEIQRQDKSKLLPGGSQTLIKVAQRYEERKRRQRQRRSSEPVAAAANPCSDHFRRRPSYLAVETRPSPPPPPPDPDFLPSIRSRIMSGENHVCCIKENLNLLMRILSSSSSPNDKQNAAEVFGVFVTCCDTCRMTFKDARVAESLTDPIIATHGSETSRILVQVLLRLLHDNLYCERLDLSRLLEFAVVNQRDRFPDVSPLINRWLSRLSTPKTFSPLMLPHLTSVGSPNALRCIRLMARLDKRFAVRCKTDANLNLETAG